MVGKLGAITGSMQPEWRQGRLMAEGPLDRCFVAIIDCFKDSCLEVAGCLCELFIVSTGE